MHLSFKLFYHACAYLIDTNDISLDRRSAIQDQKGMGRLNRVHPLAWFFSKYCFFFELFMSRVWLKCIQVDVNVVQRYDYVIALNKHMRHIYLKWWETGSEIEKPRLWWRNEIFCSMSFYPLEHFVYIWNGFLSAIGLDSSENRYTLLYSWSYIN